jgi:hypothetical protein
MIQKQLFLNRVSNVSETEYIARSIRDNVLTVHLTTNSAWEIRRCPGIESSNDPHERSSWDEGSGRLIRPFPEETTSERGRTIGWARGMMADSIEMSPANLPSMLSVD